MLPIGIVSIVWSLRWTTGTEKGRLLMKINFPCSLIYLKSTEILLLHDTLASKGLQSSYLSLIIPKGGCFLHLLGTYWSKNMCILFSFLPVSWVRKINIHRLILSYLYLLAVNSVTLSRHAWERLSKRKTAKQLCSYSTSLCMKGIFSSPYLSETHPLNYFCSIVIRGSPWLSVKRWPDVTSILSICCIASK